MSTEISEIWHLNNFHGGNLEGFFWVLGVGEKENGLVWVSRI